MEERELLAEKLEEFTVEKFINIHQHELCKRTVNQEKIAAFLHFDSDQIALIRHPPDFFGKSQRLYNFIEKTTTASNFLQALENTNNGHLLQMIQSKLNDSLTSCSGSGFGSDSGENCSYGKYGIWFNIPQLIDSFCGREEFLLLLHDKLQQRDESTPEVTVLSQVKIVSGLGGIGKTQTARKYISQYFEFYSNFIWIDAESENSMTSCFTKLASSLRIPIEHSKGKSREIEEIVKDIYNKICHDGEKSNLIVFDNADDYQSCVKFFPILPHPKMRKPVILATSRNQEWISPTGKIQVVPLEVLADDESLEFILNQLEIPEAETSEFRLESKEFIELIGGLPLALQQAVAYIKQEKEIRLLNGEPYKLTDYVQEFKSSMKKLQTFPGQQLSTTSTVVAVTWNVTFNKIQELDGGEEAIKILGFLSFLYSDKIPLSFLSDLFPEIEPRKHAESLKLLKKYSLIKVNQVEYFLSIHRQLQFVILQHLKESNDLNTVVNSLIKKFTLVLKNVKLAKSSDIFLSSYQIMNNQFNLIPVTEQFIDFMYNFALVLSKANRYSESLELHKNVGGQRQKMWGENHAKSLESQHEIALQLFKLGKYDESLALFNETLKKQEIHPDLGADHLDTVDSKYRISDVLRSQGKYKEALKLLEEVLTQRQQQLGENHHLTLRTQNAMASLHYDLRRFSSSLELYQDVEKKLTDLFGPNHTDLLYTKHCKAIALFRMRRLGEASTLFNEVYEKRKEIFGENHLDTVDSLLWMAKIMEKEWKFTEALVVFKRVYESQKNILGPDHPDTIDAKENVQIISRKIYAFRLFPYILFSFFASAAVSLSYRYE